MGTRIKPIKCPNCGSEKHTQKDDKCYLCQSCGTEFYIDDDDININVNHHFDYIPTSNDTTETGKKIGIYFFIVIAIACAFILLPIIFSSTEKTSSKLFQKDSIDVNDDIYMAVTMSHKGNPCLFYIVNRDFSSDRDNDTKHVDGVYYGFRDIKTGKTLAEQLLVSEKAKNSYNISLYNDNIRYFNQAHRWFLINSERNIFEIDPEQLTMRDVSKSLFKNKNAMSTGISNAQLLYNEYGEGIKIVNNLAEMYYYFPGTDRLYTEDAFNYAKDLPPSELNGELRDSIYYCFEKKNANSSTDKGGKYRLLKIHFKYHLGDPQNRYNFDDVTNTFWVNDGRLVSDRPITDWFTAFNAKIIYQDANYILISYNPNLSETSMPVFQLRSTKGNILWTQASEEPIYDVDFCTRSNGQIWFEGEVRYPDNPTQYKVYSLNIDNGKLTCHFTLPEVHKIPAK